MAFAKNARSYDLVAIFKMGQSNCAAFFFWCLCICSIVIDMKAEDAAVMTAQHQHIPKRKRYCGRSALSLWEGGGRRMSDAARFHATHSHYKRIVCLDKPDALITFLPHPSTCRTQSQLARASPFHKSSSPTPRTCVYVTCNAQSRSTHSPQETSLGGPERLKIGRKGKGAKDDRQAGRTEGRTRCE